MKKRIISLTLAAIMLLSLVPMAVMTSAEEGGVKYTVTDLFGEPAEQGSETYECKEDEIHIYSGDIIFSGEIDEKVFIEGPAFEASFADMVINNSVVVDAQSEYAAIHMKNTVIDGDVRAKVKGENELYFSIQIEESNEIKGSVTSDGSLTVYGWPGASLKIKNAAAETMLYLNNLRIENMKEEYDVSKTLTATPENESEPIVLTVKKEAVFPDTEEFVINNGKPFAYGEDYETGIPVVCDEDGVPFDPQPELTVVYYEYITGGEWDWEMKALDEKPEKEGTYAVAFFMPEKDPDYTGSIYYEFTIGHNLTKDNGKAPTKDSSGYKAFWYCSGCNEYFEDAEGNTAIADINAWKAEGGNGYLKKLETPKSPEKENKEIKEEKDEKVTSPETGDNMLLLVGVLTACLAGTVCIAFVRRKETEK